MKKKSDIEETVNKLAELQEERKVIENRADNAVFVMGYDRNIHDLEIELQQQKELRDSILGPFEDEIAKIDEGIESISNQIVYAWDSETMEETMEFSVGTLTLHTIQNLDIKDPAILLGNLISHFSTYRIANEFISGFKKTIVRKFIDMHPQNSSVAELISKTTVKLEVKK